MLLAAAGLGAQQAGGITACVFTIANASGDPAFQEDEQAITEAVRAQFEAAGYRVVAGQGAPAHGEEAVAAAASAEADLAVTGLFIIDPDAEAITIAVDCWQRDGTLMGGFDLEERFGLNFSNVLHDQMAALIAKVKTVTGAPRIDSLQLAALKGLGDITFHAPQDGVEVVLAGEKSLGATSDGKLQAAVGLLKGGSDLVLDLRKAGYHSVSLVVPATPDIRLPALQRANTMAIEASWTSAQPLGVGGSVLWYPVGDWVFVGGLLGLGVQTGPHWVFHLDTGARAGVYLLPYDTRIPFVPASSPLRFRVGVSMSAGVLTTRSTAATLPWALDWYVGAPTPFLELGTESVVAFFRVDMRYALGLGPNLLGRGWVEVAWPGSQATRPPITVGVSWKW